MKMAFKLCRYNFRKSIAPLINHELLKLAGYMKQYTFKTKNKKYLSETPNETATPPVYNSQRKYI
jgi:hypothetical protein